MPARLLAVGDDVDARLRLILKGEPHGVALGLLEGSGLAGVVAAGVFAWRQAGVHDHRAGGGKPGRVAGLGQDRRDLQR